VSSSFDAATDALAQHENLTRIKKLLIYVCQSVWENDPSRLDYFDLRSLVYHLLELAPSREQLRSRLDTFVRTLSKADEYMHIADTIYRQLEPLCVQEPRYQTQQDIQRYHLAAQQLRQDIDPIRIKKVLYCAYTRTWENDPAILSQIDLESLLQNLHALIPTRETLNFTLNGIVQTLNRQDYYIPIVQRIQSILAPIYTEDSTEHTQVLPAAAPARTQAPPARATKLAAPLPPPVPPRPAAAPSAAPMPASPTRPKVLDAANLMDVRLQVMKYSNPLRAKVLLFTTLFRPLSAGHRAWGVLKTHELDTLIREAFAAFKTEDELQIKLQRAAESMVESEHYVQAAGAILRALKPYYPAVTSAESDGPASAGGPDTDINDQEWTVSSSFPPTSSGEFSS